MERSLFDLLNDFPSPDLLPHSSTPSSSRNSVPIPWIPNLNYDDKRLSKYPRLNAFNQKMQGIKKKNQNRYNNVLSGLINQIDSLKREIVSEETVDASELEHELMVRSKELDERERKMDFYIANVEETINEMREEQERNLEEIERKVVCSLEKTEIVKLNIGGMIFTTSLKNLLTKDSNFFTGYFSDTFRPKESELVDGAYYIDRPGKHFELILNFLRGIDIEKQLVDMKTNEIREFITEIDYYQIRPIVKFIPRTYSFMLKNEFSIDTLDLVRFDQTNCSPNLSIDGNVVEKVNASVEYDCVLGTPTFMYTIKLLDRCEKSLFIGFAPNTVKLTKSMNHQSCGFFLNTYDGKLYSQRGDCERMYISKPVVSLPLKKGTEIRCKMMEGKISYMINDEDYGVAFTNVPMNMLPAFEILNPGCCFKFCD